MDFTQEVESAYNKSLLLPIEQLKITSKEAVEIARKEYGLLPGENWAIGYHFELNKINDELIFTVVGLNKNKEFSKIHFNAFSKNIHKIS